MLTAVRQVSEKEKFRIPYCVSGHDVYMNHIFYHESYTYQEVQTEMEIRMRCLLSLFMRKRIAAESMCFVSICVSYFSFYFAWRRNILLHNNA